MSFWTYMLHCADRTFYVGHTDDLDARIGAHQSGLIKGYTSTRLPVKLVWSDEFPTRYEALRAERQIKGWSRAKKLALIRGDWKAISALGRNSEEKERASTSSARTEMGEEVRVSIPHRSP
jgi:putative endonuclease